MLFFGFKQSYKVFSKNNIFSFKIRKDFVQKHEKIEIFIYNKYLDYRNLYRFIVKEAFECYYFTKKRQSFSTLSI